MTASAVSILEALRAVERERERRAADVALAARVRSVKAWQHARFERTYVDLLASPRYGAAARFFLEDLYGPADFTLRDRQFARIVPTLCRMFPQTIVDTVAALADLHRISEAFDTAMAAALPAGAEVDASAYGRAWREVDDAAGRARQIELMLRVGAALDGYTRNPLLRGTLRMLRGPAHAAGLGALQEFLETGFDTFRDMHGSSEFLSTIAARERELAARLFSGVDVSGNGPFA